MIEYFKAVRSYLGKYLDNFKVLVALNQMIGISYFRKFGSNDNTTTTNREVLDFYTNDTNTYNGWYDVNTQLYLISSSVSDTTQTILISGIKEVEGDWIETNEQFALNGTTAVNVGSWLRVYRLRVVAPHTALVGNIYVSTGIIVPTDSNNIAAAIMLKTNGKSKNTTKMGIFTTPTNKGAMLERVFISSISNKVGVFELEARPRGGDWTSLADFTQNDSNEYEANYEYIPSETDIRLNSYYESGSGKTATSLQFYLVDKDKRIS